MREKTGEVDVLVLNASVQYKQKWLDISDSEIEAQLSVNVVSTLKLMQAYYSEMKKNGFTEDEFLRSREQMKSDMFFRNESSNSQMILYGRYMLHFDKLFDFEEKLDKMLVKEDIEGMGYIEGMIYIAEREIERLGERKC